jgi:hypothetical protein
MIRESIAPVLAVVVCNRLPRQRRREGHGEPVEDLGIVARHDDLDTMPSTEPHALDLAHGRVLLVGWKLCEHLVLLTAQDEPLGEVREADDVREWLHHRAVHRGIGDPHQLERHVLCHHLPRPPALPAQLEARIILIQHAGPEIEAVRRPASLEDSCFWDRLGQAGDQRIGTLQIVVLEQGLVDRAGDDVRGSRVCDRRVQRAGCLAKGRVENLLLRIGVRIRIVRARHPEQEQAE